MTAKHTDPKPGRKDDADQKPASPDEEHIKGPMSKEAVHATESKNPHPQGKTRHGGRDG